MPFQSLDSLAVRVRREGPIPWQEATRLGVRLAGALECAHRVGTLHRDVKPANILLSDYGEPQITDFGIARIEGGFETATGAFTGSLSYSAPEVLNGRPPDARSRTSTASPRPCSRSSRGGPAFERREGEEIIAQFLRITGQPIPDLRGHGVPDELCAVLERAMAKDPADRPASAEAFGRELQEVQRAAGMPVAEMALPVARPVAGEEETMADPPAEPRPRGRAGRRGHRIGRAADGLPRVERRCRGRSARRRMCPDGGVRPASPGRTGAEQGRATGPVVVSAGELAAGPDRSALAARAWSYSCSPGSGATSA